MIARSAWPGCCPPSSGCRRCRGQPVASTSTAALAYDRVGLVRTSYRGQQRVHRRADRRPAGRRARGRPAHRAARARTCWSSSSRATAGSRWRTRTRPARARRRSTRGTATLSGGRLPRPQRLPRLPHLRRPQLAGPLHAPVRAAGGPPAALRRAAGQPADDAGLRLPTRRAGAPWTSYRPTRPWPEGARFYGWDRIYDAPDLGYAGPAFGYATMPDQYVLDALPAPRARRRRPRPGDGRDRPGVEPHPVGAAAPARGRGTLGDGSVYDGMPARGDSVAGGLAATRPGCATPTGGRWPTRWTR